MSCFVCGSFEAVNDSLSVTDSTQTSVTSGRCDELIAVSVPDLFKSGASGRCHELIAVSVPDLFESGTSGRCHSCGMGGWPLQPFVSE